MKPDAARKYMRKILAQADNAVDAIPDDVAVMLAEHVEEFIERNRPIMMSGKELSAFIVAAAFEEFGKRHADVLSPGFNGRAR